MNDFFSLVTEARTCRRFDEQTPLTLNNLEWLVDCARITPNARNQQNLRYVLVQQEETRLALFQKTAWAGALKDWKGPYEGERPTGFIVIAYPQNTSHLVWVDMGIAAQTIQLAATTQGWGCCILASFDSNACRTLCQLPDELAPGLVLGLGKAKEVRRLAPMPESGSFTYWRDEQMIHYVPKRALDDIIVHRF